MGRTQVKVSSTYVLTFTSTRTTEHTVGIVPLWVKTRDLSSWKNRLPETFTRYSSIIFSTKMLSEKRGFRLHPPKTLRRREIRGDDREPRFFYFRFLQWPSDRYDPLRPSGVSRTLVNRRTRSRDTISKVLPGLPTSDPLPGTSNCEDDSLLGGGCRVRRISPLYLSRSRPLVMRLFCDPYRFQSISVPNLKKDTLFLLSPTIFCQT